MNTQKRTCLFGLIISLSTIVISCARPDSAIKSAEEFGLISADFTSKTDKLSNDLYDSCLRRISYITIREGPTVRDKALADCKMVNKPAVAKTKNANRIVTDYAKSIGALASNNPVTFDDEFDNIKASLDSLNIPNSNITLSKNTIDKGTQIANVIFGWVINQQRKGTLREAIICTDQPLQEYTRGLGTLFKEGYINGVLKSEEKQAMLYYNSYTARLQKIGTERDFLELERVSSQTFQQLANRLDLAESYVAIIEKTAQAHTKLKNVFLDKSNPPSESSCNIYLKAKKSISSATLPQQQVNFSSSPLTIKEISSIRKIVLDYQLEVSPLLKKMQ
jgi:hypothetical protein